MRRAVAVKGACDSSTAPSRIVRQHCEMGTGASFPSSARALEVLEGLEHGLLVERTAVQAGREDLAAAIKVAAVLLHLGVLEPGPPRSRLWASRATCHVHDRRAAQKLF